MDKTKNASKACKKLPSNSTTEKMATSHNAKMLHKKAIREQNIPTGFVAIANEKLQRWMRLHLIDVKVENVKRIAAGLQPLDPDRMQAEAQRRACRFLPGPQMVRSHKPKPSKSDNPEYRKPTVFKSLRASAFA